MRALLLTLLLLFSTSASAQVIEQVEQNNVGQYFLRLHNYLPRYVSCYYKDQYNYFTFTIAPQTTTMWQPIYGAYVWECR